MYNTNIKNMLIIIPAYNEENNISITISNIRRYYKKVPICIINDCSNDNTRNVILNLNQENIILLTHTIRQGYGVAIQTGYKYALRKKYDIVLQMDADNQHDPLFISRYLEKMEKDNVDVVIGSRFLYYKKDRNVSISKKIAIKIFRLLILWITGAYISDPTSGYQLLNKKILKYYSSNSFPIDFPDANIISWAIKKKFKFSEIAVEMKDRSSGTSMHKGMYKQIYYMYKVMLVTILSIFVKE